VCVAKCATTPHGVVLRKKERKKNDYDMSAIVTPPPRHRRVCPPKLLGDITGAYRVGALCSARHARHTH